MKYLFVFLIYTQIGFAQFDAFESEIFVENGIAVFHNKPFTGTLYSDDEDEVPNDCSCTLMAKYKDGVLHGEYKKWNYNGKLILEAVYKNGLLDGNKKVYGNGRLEHSFLYKNNKIIQEKSFFLNGKIKTVFLTEKELTTKKFFLENGNLNKIVVYKNNKVISSKIYKSGNLISEDIIDNNIKTVIVYLPNGNKKSLYKYTLNNDLIYGGKFINNKKHGQWIHYSDDLLVKTISNFDNGTLIDKKVINTRKYIKNNKPTNNEMLAYYNNEIENATNYFLLKFDNQFVTNFPNLKKQILESVSAKTNIITNYRLYSEKEIDNLLLIEMQNNNSFSLSWSDFDGNVLEEYICNSPSDLLDNIKINVVEKNRIISKSISLNDFFRNHFPVYALISSVMKQTETEVNYVYLNKGKKDGIDANKMFVYDEDNKYKMSELTIIKIHDHKTICKVISYQEWLKKYIKTHKNVIIVE